MSVKTKTNPKAINNAAGDLLTDTVDAFVLNDGTIVLGFQVLGSVELTAKDAKALAAFSTNV